MHLFKPLIFIEYVHVKQNSLKSKDHQLTCSQC